MTSYLCAMKRNVLAHEKICSGGVNFIIFYSLNSEDICDTLQ